MRLTTKGRYAVTAILDLALHSKETPVTLTEIASRQTISLSYLEQLFAKLRKSNIVEGVRGPGGGYRLSRDATKINVAEVIAAVDETVDITKCEGKGDCQDGLPCLTHDLWEGLSDHIRTYLEKISLGDLLKNEAVVNVAKRQDQSGEQNLNIHFQEKITA